MKKLEIIIRPEKLDVLKKILTEDGISGMMISNIMGFGNQKGYTHQYRGTTYAVNLVSKLKVETVIRDEQVEAFKEPKGRSEGKGQGCCSPSFHSLWRSVHLLRR